MDGYCLARRQVVQKFSYAYARGQACREVPDPSFLRRRFWNLDSARGGESGDGLVWGNSLGGQEASGDQAGSSHALAAMDNDIFS